MACQLATLGAVSLGGRGRRRRFYTWPQDTAADVHDLLEARYHLLSAGNIQGAGEVTEHVCLQLETWGAWDQEASLIHDGLTRLAEGSPDRCSIGWMTSNTAGAESGARAGNHGPF